MLFGEPEVRLLSSPLETEPPDFTDGGLCLI